MKLTALPEWRALEAHQRDMAPRPLRELFANDPTRAERLSLEVAGLYADYSKQRVTDESLERLVALASARGVPERIASLFAGESVNPTEGRPALHTALRLPRDAHPLGELLLRQLPGLEAQTSQVVPERHEGNVQDAALKVKGTVLPGRGAVVSMEEVAASVTRRS